MKPLPERWLLLLLAAVQFTHIVDFMILMPLGPQLMRDLHIGPSQFSALVAAYTIRLRHCGPVYCGVSWTGLTARKFLLFA